MISYRSLLLSTIVLNDSYLRKRTCYVGECSKMAVVIILTTQSAAWYSGLSGRMQANLCVYMHALVIRGW